MVIASLAACEPGSQQDAEPDATQPAESAMADDEAAKMEDKFANMFTSEVTDTFSPGLEIGARFPSIRALYQGEEITTIDRFIRDRGAIFIAARSVDW